jgi:cytochrome c oxidase cbb3-type subunit 3
MPRKGLRSGIGLLLVAAVCLSCFACERERRRFRHAPAAAAPADSQVQSELQAGPRRAAPSLAPYDENAPAVAEGERLYGWFNCVGCHAHGGGAIGPPLMDDVWVYGSAPANIFETIVEGRPNGMPAFRGKIPAYQVWQLVSYVRSQSGLLHSDVAPGRPDEMSAKKPEQSMKPEKPR